MRASNGSRDTPSSSEVCSFFRSRIVLPAARWCLRLSTVQAVELSRQMESYHGASRRNTTGNESGAGMQECIHRFNCGLRSIGNIPNRCASTSPFHLLLRQPEEPCSGPIWKNRWPYQIPPGLLRTHRWTRKALRCKVRKITNPGCCHMVHIQTSQRFPCKRYKHSHVEKVRCSQVLTLAL